MLSATDNTTLAVLAIASAVQGDRPTAASCLAALRSAGADGRGLAGLPRGSSWLATMGGVTETACLLGDEDTASEAYERPKRPGESRIPEYGHTRGV